jgi:hypothetical protein
MRVHEDRTAISTEQKSDSYSHLMSSERAIRIDAATMLYISECEKPRPSPVNDNESNQDIRLERRKRVEGNRNAMRISI